MSAIISECQRYRYTLERKIDGENLQGLCCFVMLNPSTADAVENDPTITRCIGFARSWGYARLVVVNLFAFRATNPTMLNSNSKPEGADNDKYILEVCRLADRVVCAWGASLPKRHRARSWVVRKMLEHAGVSLWHLGLTAGGEPRHPLYLAADTGAKRWSRTGKAI